MAKTRTIQTGIEAPGRREDIPVRADEFLRVLARWTVEDMHFNIAVKSEIIEETSNE